MTTKKTTTASLFPLPTCVNPTTWAEFEKHRTKMRKPMTDHARELIVAKLMTYVAKGHDANSLLNTSIEMGWQTVFEPKLVAPRQQSFRERDHETKAASYAASMGRRATDANVIDMEPVGQKRAIK